MAEYRPTSKERSRDRMFQAARMRAMRMSYDDIAEQLGYSGRGSAHAAVKRAQELCVREPTQDAILLDLAELDEMAQQAWAVLRSTHYVVDRGAVVTWQGQPLKDDAPVLAAIARLLSVQERRAKLLGLDAPKRVEVSEGMSDLDAAVRDLLATVSVDDLVAEGPAESQVPAG